MFWKVLAAIVAVWLASVLIGALLKGLFWLVTVAVLIGGVYLVVRLFDREPDGAGRPPR